MEFLSKVSNYALLPALYKATANDESTVQLQVLEDIRKLTFESSQTLEFIQKFLLDKVGSSGCYSRAKCLRIFKHLIDSGPLEFTVQLRRNAQPLEKCKSFTGPLDPLHGDAPYLAVRQAATQVLDLLYDDNRDIQRRMNSMPTSSSKMTGIAGPQSSGGSDGSGGYSSMSSSSSGSKMWGFGNAPQQEEATLFDKLKEKASSVVDNIQQKTSSSSSRYDGSYVTSNLGGNLSSAKQPLTYQSQSYANARYSQPSEYSEPISERTAGRPGGGWDDAEDSQQSTSSSTSRSSKTSQLPPKPVDQAPRREAAVQQVDETPSVPQFILEQRLVEEITTVSGVRAAPSREQVQHFVTRCKRLNVEHVIQLLAEILSVGTSQTQVRVLCLIEALLHHDVRGAVEQIEEQLPRQLQELSQTSQGAVLSKSKKLLQQIQPLSPSSSSQLPGASTSTAPAPPSTASHSSDLLGLLDSMPPSSSVHESGPQAGNTALSDSSGRTGQSMFDGLLLGGTLTQSEQITSVSQEQNAAAMSSAAVSNAVNASLFGGMDIKPMSSSGVVAPSNTVHPANAPQVSQQTPSQTELSSLLGGMTVSSVPASSTLGDNLMSNTEVDPFDPLKGSGVARPVDSSSTNTVTTPMYMPTMQAQGMPAKTVPSMQMASMGGIRVMGMTSSGAPSAMHMPSSGGMMTSPRGQMSMQARQPAMMSPAQPMYAGSMARTEVQLFSSGGSGPSGTNFGFLGQNSKGGAFDFVQDAMKAHKK